MKEDREGGVGGWSCEFGESAGSSRGNKGVAFGLGFAVRDEGLEGGERGRVAFEGRDRVGVEEGG